MSTVLIPLVVAVLVLALVRVLDLLPALVPTASDRGDRSDPARSSSDLPG